MCSNMQPRQTSVSGLLSLVPTSVRVSELLSLSALQWTQQTDARTLLLNPTAQFKGRMYLQSVYFSPLRSLFLAVRL